jgi:hypothetical protein
VLVVDVDSSVAAGVVSVVAAVAVDSVAVDAVTGVLTAGIDGIVGIVPTESSYTGRSASGLGCRGAGRIVYAFVTTGTVVDAGAYEDDDAGELPAGA